MPRRTASGSSRTALRVVAAIACLALGFALAWTPAGRAVLVGGVLLLPPGAVILGIRRHRPASRRAWQTVAAGLGAIGAGILAWFVGPLVGVSMTAPSFTDVSVIAGYGLVALGVERLARQRGSEEMRAFRLDALIIAVAAGLAVWVIVIDPVVEDTKRTVASLLYLAIYPLIDVAILASLAHLLVGSRRSVSVSLMAVAALGSLVSHLEMAVEQASNTYQPGTPTDLGWCVALICFAAAALHPSMAAPPESDRGRPIKVGPLRLVALAGAVSIIPAFLLAGPAINLKMDVRDLGAGGLILGLLVVLRLADTVSRLSASLHRRAILQEELSVQATHDPLTGLANRAEFTRRASRALDRDRAHVAVLFLDVDDFKAVNDSHGHAVGDAVLEAVGRRIEATVRSGDLVARLGGDEFAILLEHTLSVRAAGELATRLLAALSAPFEIAGQALFAHASIGVAMGRDDLSVDNLLRDADVAMYLAKGQGKARFEAFEPTMHAAVLRRIELRSELEAAITNREFVLHYQPIVTFCKRTVYACEALARWQHPTRGLVGPDEFIPLAEETGLIVPLGR